MEIHEHMIVIVVAQGILAKDQMAFLALSNGEEIRLDRIVKIDEELAPNYAHINDFSCDC